MKTFSNLVCVLGAVMAMSGNVKSQNVIQIDVKSLLNSRPVTTYSNGKFYPWVNGTDPAGNGYITKAVAIAAKISDTHALVDDGFFPANAEHPDVQLNYNNSDSTSKQSWFLLNAGEFTVTVPEKNYSRMLLCFTSGATTNVTFTLNYTDGAVTKVIAVPKYDDPILATDTVVCNVASDIGKWDSLNKVKMVGAHNITGIELYPDSNRVLKSIRVQKLKSYFNFWGATGVAMGKAPEPTVPSGLKASNVSADAITLSWTPSVDSNGIAEYEVFKGAVSCGTTKTTTIDLSGLTCNTTYTFSVKALDSLGNWSAASRTFSVKTSSCATDTEAPSTPSGLAANAITQSGLTLSWDASTDNIGVTLYYVYRGSTLCGTTASTSLNITGLSASTLYPFVVKAKDAAGNFSANSAVLNVTTSGVGISDENQSLITVYPNPMKEQLFIGGMIQGYKVTICNAGGKVMLQEQELDNTAVIDVSDFAAGLYIIKVADGQEIQIRRIVKE